MDKLESLTKKEQEQEDIKKYSEVNEFNHERNHVAKAQKQMASQETTGVLDQE
ncbi:hypothetical protein [Alkalihalobacillus deserti]|uniref:hypothetical protein n=1 Tax=Alkalihalobacillus deserti TaxID=2879466 RepID=UPI001D141D2C|nr:hypothetical protein [Alkalihalobacillus deserti]